ncbi:FAD-dependent oxidoreductase [Catellatospora sp. TT07R-123]|uniref:glycerol-3-phosphate dehydrogenase/oxidase n=1 Tax=Catellatospora sp. TT07R-123 TaxID=2733863 RepID=UPI001B01DA67|nr:glycerol-3-phosphate dehydrogenase/oxidase [Catellatospora sp. TT07R-123]GHJ43022.1 FAD-dependent oxidoreductase [Catellatospora sp. TT07R-123]
MRTGRLSPHDRDAAVAALAERDDLDILVIGGGVVGAGAALDAATRGLRVGLVEARDWAGGTSGNSSKLIHGGLRYLEMLDFGLVREALRERSLLMRRLAPHLVQPVPFLYPLAHRGWERVYAGAGLMLYDSMGSSGEPGRSMPRHRHLSRREALRACPSLRPDALTGAIQYHDAQVDDARYTMFLVRTAVAHGALAANRVRAVDLLRDGDRVVGARLHDTEHDRFLDVRARQVVNATGVWTDDVNRMTDAPEEFTVRASKGVHLVVPEDRLRLSTGLILRTASSVLFVIPWEHHWIIGTTDTDWHLDPSRTVATGGDIDYLLREVNKVLLDPLTRDDVQAVYAGLRPLISRGSKATAKLSREHAVASPAPGLVTVAGGKFTTYRVMAADAVDAAARAMAVGARSCTDQVPLVGADGFTALRNRRRELAAAYGLHPRLLSHLLSRHGGLVDEVLSLLRADPGLARPLEGAERHLRAEIHYAASHEGARRLDDVLTRRTRISLHTRDRGTAAARPAAEIMAEVLGWDGDRIDREVEEYLRHIEAEHAASEQLDDESAVSAREGLRPAARV